MMPRSCGVLHGPGQGGDHPGGGTGRHRLDMGLEPGRERRPVAIRRGDVGDRAPLIGLEDRDDMGVIQHGRGVRLAHEAPPSLRGREPLGQRDLQRHIPAEDPVAREVDDPETAPADLPHHLEAAERQRRAAAPGSRGRPLARPDHLEQAEAIAEPGPIAGHMRPGRAGHRRVGGQEFTEQSLVDRREFIGDHGRAPVPRAAAAAPAPRPCAGLRRHAEPPRDRLERHLFLVVPPDDLPVVLGQGGQREAQRCSRSCRIAQPLGEVADAEIVAHHPPAPSPSPRTAATSRSTRRLLVPL